MSTPYSSGSKAPIYTLTRVEKSEQTYKQMYLKPMLTTFRDEILIKKYQRVEDPPLQLNMRALYRLLNLDFHIKRNNVMYFCEIYMILN